MPSVAIIVSSDGPANVGDLVAILSPVGRMSIGYRNACVPGAGDVSGFPRAIGSFFRHCTQADGGFG